MKKEESGEEGGAKTAMLPGQNYKIPIGPKCHKFFLNVQKVLRMNALGVLQNQATVPTNPAQVSGNFFLNSTTGARTIAGYGATQPWYYIPNQTWACYMWPRDFININSMVGTNGSVRMVKCGCNIFDSKILMNLPYSSTLITTVEKPYWKVFEDNQHLLYGHALISPAATNTLNPPCLNPLGDIATLNGPGNMNMSLSGMNIINMYQYIHTLPGPAADFNASWDLLPVEQTGDVEFYNSGDCIDFEWNVNTPPFMLKNQAGGINTFKVKAYTTGNGNNIWDKYIGEGNNQGPIARYDAILNPNIAGVNYSTQNKDWARDSYEYGPPMVLISIPIIDNSIANPPSTQIATQLQLELRMHAVIEVERFDQYDLGLRGYTTNTALPGNIQYSSQEVFPQWYKTGKYIDNSSQGPAAGYPGQF